MQDGQIVSHQQLLPLAAAFPVCHLQHCSHDPNTKIGIAASAENGRLAESQEESNAKSEMAGSKDNQDKCQANEFQDAPASE